MYVKKSQYKRIKNPLHKQSEKACICSKRDVLELATLRYILSIARFTIGVPMILFFTYNSFWVTWRFFTSEKIFSSRPNELLLKKHTINSLSLGRCRGYFSTKIFIIKISQKFNKTRQQRRAYEAVWSYAQPKKMKEWKKLKRKLSFDDLKKK